MKSIGVIVGLDVGTQSLKATVVDQRLRLVGEAAIAYSPHFPRPGWAEQDPALWERAMAPAIARALERAAVQPANVLGMGICGQLDGCVPVDTAGRALGPCLIWSDRRAVDCLPEIPTQQMLELTGVVPDASHMAAKIRWLKRQQNATGKASCYHAPVSYLVAQLTGEQVFDEALASTTMLYGLERRDFEPSLLAAFDVDRSELPRIASSWEPAGGLTAHGAHLTGLPKGTTVAVGTGDDFANPLGAGMIAPGRIICTVGTAEVVGAHHPARVIDEAALVETHRYTDQSYFINNPGWLSGGAVTWLQGLLGIESPAQVSAIAAHAPPGSAGLLFLPALGGAMAPEWVAGARGAFYGMTPKHDKSHFCRAILEGCAYAMRDVVGRLTEMGVAGETIVMLGGGAGSRLWGQIRADLTGRIVEQRVRHDTSPMGAAVLAAVASGCYDDLKAAAADIQSTELSLQPEPARLAVMEGGYRDYRRLFESLRPMFGGH